MGMVIYDLQCVAAHQFEGWFRSIDDYTWQHERKLIICPVCDSSEVVKLPTASRINTQSHEPAQSPVTTSTRSQIEKLYQYLDRHCEDVGTEFAEQARRIHYGETEPRNILGQTTRQEAQELNEEGVEVLPLPHRPDASNKLN